MGRSLENNPLHPVETTVVTEDIVVSHGNDIVDPRTVDENTQTS